MKTEEEKKCPYCGRKEKCMGFYPEGCFFEHEPPKIIKDNDKK